jgi:protein-L-isoaspartate(D-aspartate) O-methyltransferase
MMVADGWDGYPDQVPYNCIHAGASFVEIPLPLIDQLAEGGLVMIPVGKELSN